MSRPRGPKRYDRPEDREAIKEACLEARAVLSELSQRVSFSAPHYHPVVDVGIQLLRIAQMLGYELPVPHSIKCGHPPHDING